MEEQNTTNRHDHCCSAGCCQGHWGKSSLTRILLALLLAMTIFLFGLAVGRLSVYEYSYRTKPAMMLYRDNLKQSDGSSVLMRQLELKAQTPNATSTKTK